jgi:hypothetical protein
MSNNEQRLQEGNSDLHGAGMHEPASKPLASANRINAEQGKDTRGTISESPLHLFAPVSTTAADEVAQTLQSLSVANSTNSSSSGMTSCDPVGGRRDVVTPPMGTVGGGGGFGSLTTASTSGGASSYTGGMCGGTPTPELSPSLLASLRGSSSPSHSQVSVGSIGPALTSAALSHKYDLTPVTRNTSDLYCDVTNKDSVMTITPSSQEGYLHGEHLAFPSDFSSSASATGHSIPPLQPVHRTSINSGPRGLGEDTIGLQSQMAAAQRLDLNVPEPMQFPSRKYYSFTTRKQYEDACLQDGGMDSDDDLYNRSDSDDDCAAIGTRLTPYAPRSRPANFDIERVPEEELKRIFITRGTNANNSTDARLLTEIPLDQRVPSLHMANNLHGSTTSVSYTDHEDEDSVLHLRDNDDASLSSRGSSLYLPAEEDMVRAATHVDDSMESIVDDEVFLLLQRKQRKRKQRKKEQRAVEWLQSVEADQNILAEAASSKFLTGSNSPAATTFRRQPAIALSRQVSSPSTLLSSKRQPPS